MALDPKTYEPSLQYGAKITGAEISVAKHYTTLAVPTNGSAVAVNVFGTAAPVAGTITGFLVTAGGTTAGNITLFATTAGTLVQMAYGTTIGLISGTNVLNGAVTAGDTVTVTSSSVGTATAFITFQTAS